MTDQNRGEWLSALKPGDRVAYRDSRSVFNRHSIYTIERLTETQIVVRNGTLRFRLKDGRVIGERYGHIVPVTPEIEEMVERADLKSWLYTMEKNSSTLPIETLRAMKAAAEGAEK